MLLDKREYRRRIIVGCCLLLMSAGCYCPRPRHGFILQGDWSLELNRIPWLASRDNVYQGGCLGVPGCSGRCLPEVDGPATSMDEPGSNCGVACGGVRCGQRACGICRGLPARGVQPDPSGGAVATGYHNHPRFHPVPTQPVFFSGSDRYSVIDGKRYPDQSVPTESDSPQSGPSAPTPEPEEIPAPPPTSSQGWKARDSEQSDEVSGGGRWIFYATDDAPEEPKSGSGVRVGLRLDDSARRRRSLITEPNYRTIRKVLH